MADALFDTIARMQGERPWGAVLDAGTGSHSLTWVRGLDTDRWVAVTGAPSRERALREAVGDAARPHDRVVTGNWTDPTLLHGERFDTVLADYLLGAVAGFAPYFQDRLFARLRPHVVGTLYVVGLAPYPDQAHTEGGRFIQQIAALRDACILLAGHRTYREYPRDWVIRSLSGAGFRVDDAVSVPIVYRPRFLRGQLDVCRRKLPYFRDRGVARAMETHIDAVEAEVLALPETARGIHFGEDYVVRASPV
jgi:hypothetical protein